MDVAFRINLVKGKRIDWPRLEDANYIMVAGSARPLIDALRIAHIELVRWLETDYGFNRWDAYELLGQLAESTVANVVDPNYTVVAKFPKKYLPPPVAR
jgi:acetamidase/formamidase